MTSVNSEVKSRFCIFALEQIRSSIVLCVIVILFCNRAFSFTIDFEDYPMDTVITDQYASLGVIFKGPFSDIFVPSVQGFYSPTLGYEFPSHSGNNVLATSGWRDNEGVYHWERIIFLIPVSYISFFYTNGGWVSFEAFAYDEVGNVVDSYTIYADFEKGIYAKNTYGYDLVEFTTLGIKYIELRQCGLGGMTIDDLSFTPVPEPSTIFLVDCGLVSLAGLRRKLEKVIKL